MEVQKLLQTAASATVDNNVRSDAARQLQQAAAEHFGPYLVTLAQTLSPENGAPLEVRMLAALAMKNELTAKNERDRALKSQRWAEGSIQREGKDQIKVIALSALADSNNGVASSAAQLVASIATIELPRGEWPDLTVLLVAMTNKDQPSNVKKAALTTIGYICENANPADPSLSDQMNGFLTAIIQAAQKAEADETVRVVAINALSNSLEFIRQNFEREAERNLIMMAVCEATQGTGEELQSAAFGCLAKIMHHYYEFMKPYMEQALFSLTVTGMNSEFDAVQCMAIEFWSTISEAEYDMQLEESEGVGGQQSFRFVTMALSQVLPPILRLLVKEDEDQAEDDWNVVMAAGTCVELMAKAAKDAVLDITMAFVAPNIQSANWAEREAAVMAFGSVLEGPDLSKLVQIVQSSLQPLAAMIKDESLSVRETVAWSLGRIADFVVAALNTPQQLQILLEAVILGLQDNPRVVTHSCWTIMNLSEQLNPIPQAEHSMLSPFYELMTSSLIQASNRPDNEHSSRTSAYEALSSLVIYAPYDTLPLILNCSATCDQRIHASLQMQTQVVSVDDRQNVEELQINLLGWLTSIIRRVENQVLPAADSIMSLLGQLLSSKFPNSLIEDDIFIALGAVAGSINEEFAKYVPALIPYIITALNETELTVSSTAVGLITDITHALNENMSEYVGGFMNELSKILTQFDSIRPELVPPALACIGDLAAVAGPTGQFDIYLPGTEEFLSRIGQNMHFTPEASIEAQIHVATVKESTLDAHVGIVAGYRDEPAKLQPYIPSIYAFLGGLCQDATMMELASPSTVRTLVGLIGDIGSMYPGKQFKSFFQEKWVSSIIMRAMHADNASSNETGRYALREQQLQLA